ncbi:MAG: DUF418 domain-containing protein [Anaerolineales bacterium]|nr:DUF418 domain-containing protein [Anaerolineales bacterium]
MEAAVKSAGAESPEPVRGKQRIDTIDILRGFALFGVLTFNIIGFSGQSLRFDAWTSGLDKLVYILTQFLVQAKFYSLFSFLFGWGMSMQMIRAEARGVKYLPLYVKRILLLLLIGSIHAILIWDGDILTDYAILGLVLILFRKRSNRFLLISVVIFLSASALLQAPWSWVEVFRNWYAVFTEPARTLFPGQYSNLAESYFLITRGRLQSYITSLCTLPYYFGKIFSMFLLGFYFGKNRIFQKIPANIKLFRWLCLGGFLVGFPLNYIFTRTWVDPSWLTGPYATMISNGARTFGAPALAIFYIAGIVLILQTKGGRAQLEPLANVGRMALTNYISHSVFFTLIFYGYGLGWYGRFGPFTGLLITVGTYLLQLRLSHWWFDHYQFGPLEWVWRTLTYGRRQPFRLGVTYADLAARQERFDADEELKARRERRVWLGVWALLAAWATALSLWSGGINRQSDAYRAITAGLQEASSSSSAAANSQASSGSSEVTSRPTPVVFPLVYEPGELAASGDVLELAQAFNVERAFEEIALLSADIFSGREAGSVGGAAAGVYLAEQFADAGLQPGSLEGGFFQTFPVNYSPLAAPPILTIHAPGGIQPSVYQPGEDFSAMIGRYAGAGVGQGNVIWGNNCTREDFSEIVITGEVVFCREIDGVDSGRNALEHGAAALLLFAGDDAAAVETGVPHQAVWLSEPLPVLRVTADVAGDLLAGSGYSLADLTLLFEPIRLATSAYVQVEALSGGYCLETGCLGHNVIGIIPGREEPFRDEVVLITASMDSLGATPEGNVYPGANSNASGAAVLLEIARTWQQEGFVPLRTVVFLALDGSWQEQTGLSYFLDHPVYPLERVVQVIHVGAVGSSAPAGIYTSDSTDQILAAAAGLGVDVMSGPGELQEVTTFSRYQVPVWGLEGCDAAGRVPLRASLEDTADNIDLTNLGEHGQLVHVLLLISAESEPAIQSVLDQRAEAIEDGDLDLFLSLSVPGEQQADQAWFEDAQSYSPVIAAIRSDGLIAGDGEAAGMVEAQIQYLDEDGEIESQTLRSDIRFEQVSGEWRWAGPDLQRGPGATTETSEGRSGFALLYPGSMEEDPAILLEALRTDYASIARLMGLPSAPEVTLMVFPNNGELRAAAGYSLPRTEAIAVLPGLARIGYQEGLQDSPEWRQMLAAMVLAEAGVEGEMSAWIRDGLALAIQVADDPAVWQPNLLRALHNLTSSEEALPENSSAWARVEYIRQEFGWRGLGSFILALGRACSDGRCEDESGIAQALLSTTRMDEPAFEAAWRGYWDELLSENQQRLDDVLDSRVAAIAAGDLSAFRNTVDSQVPALLAEETAWFEALLGSDVETFNLTGEIEALLDDGSMLARVTTEFALSGVDDRWGEGSLPLTIRFRLSQGRLLWGGMPYESISDGHIQVLFPFGAAEMAAELLAVAAEQAEIVTENLGMGYSQPIVIKLYTNGNGMRASINLGQAVPGADPSRTTSASIKIYTPGEELPEDVETYLGRAIIRTILYNADIASEWLVRAISAVLSGLLDGRETELLAMENLSSVVRSVRREELLDLREVPSDDDLDEGEFGFYTAQAWSSMEYLLEQAGASSLTRLLAWMRTGMALEDAVARLVGMDFTSFQAAWQESLLSGDIDAAWVEMAYAFNSERAMNHVLALTTEEMTGRQMGTEGGAAAASYIASQFAELGLQPAGDVLVGDRLPSEGEAPAAADPVEESGQSYMQYFPVDVVELAQAPILELVDPSGQRFDRFTYRAEFSMAPIVFSGPSEITAEVVWVLSDDYSGLDFGGRIILRDPVYPVEEEIAMAEEHGAGGLILVGDYDAPRDTLLRNSFTTTDLLPSTIPVFEIHPEPFERILVQAGLTRISAYQTPPALRLGFDAFLSVHQQVVEGVWVANVLGLLPGSDPSRRDEIVILSAHLDHVGDDPDAVLCETAANSEPVCETIPGLRYSGENDDASGVAVLLEIARLWQETGYQPARSILFAAWNGQEQGELGSSFYIDHPAFPLADTVAILQLDAVGGGAGYYLETSGILSQDGYLLYTMQTVEELVDGRLHLNYQVQNGAPARPRPESFYDLFDQTGLSAVSDHLPFREAGIPALLLRWRGADESNLPDELADEVEESWLDFTGRMVSMAMMIIAR